MVAIAAMLKIYLEFFSSETKGQLTRKLVGSIRVTYRSKTANIVRLEI